MLCRVVCVCVWHVACCWPKQPHSQASSGYRSLNVAHTMTRHDTRATTKTTTTTSNNYNYYNTMRTLTLNDFLVQNNNNKRQQIHNSVYIVYTNIHVYSGISGIYIAAYPTCVYCQRAKLEQIQLN